MPDVNPPNLIAPEAPMWVEAAAAMLGRLSGKARKGNPRAADAARANGRKPCAPGKRRGRPVGWRKVKPEESKDAAS
jgi:hypothetical protein